MSEECLAKCCQSVDLVDDHESPEPEVVVFARVAVWKPMPQDDRQWVIDAAKSVPGVLDAYHLVDPETGNGLSVAFFEDDVDVNAVRSAVSAKGAGDRLA